MHHSRTIEEGIAALARELEEGAQERGVMDASERGGKMNPTQPLAGVSAS
jgi:hypothetical protein